MNKGFTLIQLLFIISMSFLMPFSVIVFVEAMSEQKVNPQVLNEVQYNWGNIDDKVTPSGQIIDVVDRREMPQWLMKNKNRRIVAITDTKTDTYSACIISEIISNRSEEEN